MRLKWGVEFGSSSRDVDVGDLRIFEPFDDAARRLLGHDLLAMRARAHMAMRALLVAVLAHVDLQRGEFGAIQAGNVLLNAVCEL